MAIDTRPWDSAEVLKSGEDVVAYLDAWLEDGTPEEIRAALGTIARSRGISELARQTGISRAGLYKALGEDGNPSFETMRTILRALGLRLTVEPAEKAEAA
jgi:probable addiction module antidote protein